MSTGRAPHYEGAAGTLLGLAMSRALSPSLPTPPGFGGYLRPLGPVSWPMSWALAVQLPPFPGHSDGVKDGQCDLAKTGTHRGS